MALVHLILPAQHVDLPGQVAVVHPAFAVGDDAVGHGPNHVAVVGDAVPVNQQAAANGAGLLVIHCLGIPPKLRLFALQNQLQPGVGNDLIHRLANALILSAPQVIGVALGDKSDDPVIVYRDKAIHGVENIARDLFKCVLAHFREAPFLQTG